MKQTFGAIGGIATISATVLFYYHHDTPGIICASIVVLCAIVFAFLETRDRNSERSRAIPQGLGGITFTAVATDDNTRLVIKAISNESNGFMTLSDIARNANLPPKIINKALDWLLINNFAIQRKGRNGKLYILTPEGRSTFSQLINGNINKPST